ncbi:MAG: HlyD family efflux transporter periplasmic adaptor subunit [Methylococcaceae bacterium]|nr:HlyD family efflux transporter periplasmic adaptor subunit [Methylococcaceae bacterium]
MPETLETLPPLREELELFKAAAAFDGAPTWTLYDPANQKFYRLNKLETEILSHWGLVSPELILEQLVKHCFNHATIDDIVAVLKFLNEHNLLQQHGQQALQQRLKQAQAAKQHWLKKLLHHYLFFKIPIFRPDKFLSRSYPAIKWLYQPSALYILISVLIINLFLLIDRWGMFSQTFLHFFSTEGFIYYSVALIFSKILHELGHAYTAHRYGCKVSSMGVAFLVMWPMLYTDTSDAWKLSSRNQRLAIGGAGMGIEVALAIVCTSLWHFLPDGMLRSSVFLMATTTWIMTLLVSLNPFMRFDGYFLFSDYLGVANLQHRAFALARWRLRRLLFAFTDAIPEKFPDKLHKTLLIYAWSTWVYRFFLFLGIALMVYYFFFKLLGLFLMLVEVTWFILLPITKELSYWIKQREQMHFNKNTLITFSVVLLFILALFIPWQSRIEAPALLSVAKHTELFMPLAAKLNKVLVTEGQSVKKGQVLLQFDSDDIEAQLQQQKIKIEVLRWQISFHGQETTLINNRQILLSELASAETEYQSLIDEQQKLVITAPFAGKVLNLNEILKQGQWFAKDESLLMLAEFDEHQLEAYVSEEYLMQIKNGNNARFFPEQIQNPAIDAKIISIDKGAAMSLKPAFSSRYTGNIAVQENHSELIPQSAVYRVLLKLDVKQSQYMQTLRGYVMMDAEAQTLASLLWKRIAGALIKELGL